MGHYELVILFHPYKLAMMEDALSPYLELIAKTGELVALERWGRRTLAYPIKKLLKAEYVFLQFSSTPEVLAELNKASRFDPLVLRCLTIRLKGEPTYLPTELIEVELTNKLLTQLNLIVEESPSTQPELKEEVL